MQESKWVVQSRTILGIVTMLMVTFAPMLGLSFSETDVGFINQQFDAVLIGLGGVLGIYGRLKAVTAVTALPTSNSKIRSPAIVTFLAVGAALILGGCSAVSGAGGLTPAELARLSPQARYFQIESEYAIAVEEAAVYANQQFCSSVIIVRCAVPSVVIALAGAKDAVSSKLDAIKPIVLAVDSAALITAKEQGDALAATRALLGAMTGILTTLAIVSN